MSNDLDDEIMVEETRMMIQKLKSGKAGGVCEVWGEIRYEER